VEQMIAEERARLAGLNDLPQGVQLDSVATVRRTDEPLAACIDHTLLKPEADSGQISRLCSEAREYGFASVCINPRFVAQCARELAGSAVRVCTVIGFPLGANHTAVKVFETVQAIADGAQEVDMVLAVGALRSGDVAAVANDIYQVTQAAHALGVPVKVILETGLLDTRQKVTGCLLAARAGADFVKTSTGFGPGGATVEDIRLMRACVGTQLGVKASGGVRNAADAAAVLAAGANRIGASAGVAIVTAAAADHAGSGSNPY
jgi:deoxyribose-phosphate aldolase